MMCDRCALPIRDGEARYTIADSEDGKVGRHADCHTSPRQDAKVALARANAELAKIRRLLGRGR